MSEYKLQKKNYNNIITICFLLLTITATVYFPVIHHDFIDYDDYEYVVENRHVCNGLSADGIRWSFFSFHRSNWHPVTWMSHMLDCQLFGLDAGKHHVTSLFIHIFNTILLFFVFYRSTDSLLPSAFTPAFFALHPMHVESVAWIAERKDLLSTFFMLSAFLFYIDWVKTKTRLKYWMSVVFFLSGLMSKPMIVTFPFLMILFDYWPLQRFSSNGIKSFFRNIAILTAEKIPFFILSGISCLITVIAQKNGGAIASVDIYPVSVRLYNAIVSYFEYVKKLFYPVNLALPYPHPGDKTGLMLILIPIFFLVIISSFVLININRKKYLAVGWFWYIGTLILVIGIIQVGEQAMADRYTYIPYIGLFIIILWFCNDLRYRNEFLNRISLLFFSSALIILTVMTSLQIKYWANSMTLFEHAIKVTSNNYIAHSNLGFSIMAKKDIPLEKASEHFREAIRIKPDFAIAHLNLGVCLSAVGEEQKALESYSMAIKYKPDYAQPYNNIGNYFLRKGRYTEALNYYNKAVQIDPDFGDAYKGIGYVYVKTGDVYKAIYFFKKALIIMPEDETLKNIDSYCIQGS